MLKRAFVFFVLLMLTVGVAQAESIDSFSTNVQIYTPGQTISVSWQVSGVQLAILEVYDATYPAQPVLTYILPTAGTRNLALPVKLTSGINLFLTAANRSTTAPTHYVRLRTTSLGLTSNVPTTPLYECRQVLSPSGQDQSNCVPGRTEQLQAAYQPFENGFMLWRGDGGDVWVFAKSGFDAYYTQSAYASLPDNSITTPTPNGRSVPAHAFGRIWGSIAKIRNTLGWALGPEISYTMTVHATFYPFTSDYFDMSLPDSQSVRVGNTGWWLVRD